MRAVGVMDDVLLADLTAPGVMAGYFCLNLEQLASRDYTHATGVGPGACDASTMTARCCSTGALSVAQQLSRQEHRPVRACQRKVSVIEDIDLVDPGTGRVSLPPTASAWKPDPGLLEPDDESVLKQQENTLKP